MADVYKMPVPQPPTDRELDDLDVLAADQLTSIAVSPAGRQIIRLQREVIRKLRVALAAAESRADSVQAVANMRRDMEVAATALRVAADDQSECEGSLCPPLNAPIVTTSGATEGRCPVCNAVGPLDGEVMERHERPDPPVRPA